MVEHTAPAPQQVVYTAEYRVQVKEPATAALEERKPIAPEDTVPTDHTAAGPVPTAAGLGVYVTPAVPEATAAVAQTLLAEAIAGPELYHIPPEPVQASPPYFPEPWASRGQGTSHFGLTLLELLASQL